MKFDSRKIDQLRHQFPFLDRWLSALVPSVTDTDDFTIRVQVADSALMYRVADNVGVDDGSYLMPSRPSHAAYVGRQQEYLFAVDHTGAIINQLTFAKDREEHRAKDAVYGCSVLWAMSRDGSYYTYYPLHEKIKYVVWVTMREWCERSVSEDNTQIFGALARRSVEFTVYRAPEQGFRGLESESNLLKDLVIDSRNVLQGVVRHDVTFLQISGMLDEMAAWFQDMVYMNGMKTILDQGQYRAASGSFDRVKVVCAELAGRDRVMIEDAECYITFQGESDTGHLGAQGYRGTLPQIRALVQVVVSLWNFDPVTREQFKPSDNVSIA